MVPAPVSPLVSQEEPGAGLTVPGAVGVPGQAALGAAVAVELAPLQAQLDHAQRAGHEQLLLQTPQEASIISEDQKPVYKGSG